MGTRFPGIDAFVVSSQAKKKGPLPLIRSELEDACLRCKTDGGVARDSSGFGASLRKRDPSAR